MAMTPENYVGLEKRCKELSFNCNRIIEEFEVNNNTEVEIEAVEVYDELIKTEGELERALINVKTVSIRKKYNACLVEIKSFKNKIYLIAHVI